MPNELTKKMQIGAGVPAVVENPKLGVMTDKALRPRLIGGARLLMPSEPKPLTGAGRGRMAAVAKLPATRQTAKTRPDMQAKKPVRVAAAAAATEEGYVRLQVRVVGDEITVVGAKSVEGPLAEPARLQGPLAYEVTLGGKRLAAGSVPDMGERRSFPNPDGPPEQRGHFISHVGAYELAVRIPKASLSAGSLPRVGISLLRLKDELPEPLAPAVPIVAQFPREAREIASVKGLSLTKLAAPVQTQLRKALG
jgi:hypothetical protein